MQTATVQVKKVQKVHQNIPLHIPNLQGNIVQICIK